MKNRCTFVEMQHYLPSSFSHSLHLSSKFLGCFFFFLWLPVFVTAQPKPLVKKSPPPVSSPKSNQYAAKVVPTSQKMPANKPKTAQSKAAPPKNNQTVPKPAKKDNWNNKGAKNEPTSTSSATKSRGAAAKTNPQPSYIEVKETGDFRNDMLNAVNRLRTNGCQCGGTYMPPVPKLSWSSLLEEAAIGHARDMLNGGFMSHISSDGSEFDTRIDRTGYKWLEVGENVARGQINLQQVVNDWRDSPSHCKTLMNSEFKEIGAARAGACWVQDFGKPMN